MTRHEPLQGVRTRRERLAALARELWDDPEVALAETASAERLQAALREAGFTVETGVGGIETGFVARYGEDEPVVGTMGEFDALPGMSQRAVAEPDPVEPDAPGHGCGHNLFGVASLGGALAVRDAIERGDVTGSVVYLGTPAEEAGGGKVYMVRDGAFDDVDAVVSWHPGWYNAPGKGSCLAMDTYEVTFSGTSSHAAAAPEAGRSALDALQLANTGVEYMREHVPDEARLHYVVADGGDVPNVVPATATGHYVVRAPDRGTVEELAEWLREIVAGAARMAQVDATVTKTAGYHEVVPNTTLGDAIGERMAAVGGFELDGGAAALADDLRDSLGDVSGALDQLPDEHRERAAEQAMYTEPLPALDDGEVGMYSTDSGDVSWQVPLGRFTAATWPVGTPAHSWQAVAAGRDVGLEGMFFAASVIGGTLTDLLADPDLLAAAREEFDERRSGREYESPMPADADPYELLGR